MSAGSVIHDCRERRDCGRDGRLFRALPALPRADVGVPVIFLDIIEIPAIFFLGIWFVKGTVSGVGSIGTSTLMGGVRLLGTHRRLCGGRSGGVHARP